MKKESIKIRVNGLGKNDHIEGIKMSSFMLNEVKLKVQVEMSKSDANELIKLTDFNEPNNPVFCNKFVNMFKKSVYSALLKSN